ncbi:hypothetical protein [Salinimicrobium marinum]|uniref:hypothetical protein n=1 Tax=Salinimicrobium marinum TaxID=680283 RepID=UPI0016776D7E|nr:hypothetical protein [Salinimicrobium marinum]
MKNKHLVKKLHELKATHIEMIDPKQGINMTCGLASNYSELVNLIAICSKPQRKPLMAFMFQKNPISPIRNITLQMSLALL